ncbi:MAG: CocE/NonD family hydrolase, partial [Caulobacter sp.]
MHSSMKVCAAVMVLAIASPSLAQDYSQFSDAAIERELAQKADVTMFEMVPMRDGVRLATNVYRPKGAKGPLPTILIKTPYNELSYKVG